MFWNPFKKLELLIMATRDELVEAIGQTTEAIKSLALVVSTESEAVRGAIAVLEAKSLQGQIDPSIPMDYSSEIETIKASLNALKSITESVDAIYPDVKA